MSVDHAASPVTTAQSHVAVQLRTESGPKLTPRIVAHASGLLAQLRHLLESGCDTHTALDLLAEAELALLGEDTSSARQPDSNDEPEILNLSRLLGDALSMARSDFQQAGITILRRKTPPRFVRAVESELRRLLHDLLMCAVRGCGSSPCQRILRFHVRNNPDGFPSLTLEHSGAWADDCKVVTNRSPGIEFSQDPTLGTVTLTFLNRA